MSEIMPILSTQVPGGRWIFLTLTVKNCQTRELREQLLAINAGFKKLKECKFWPAIGWSKSVEVTVGMNNDSHPHLHCLLLVKSTYFNGNYYLKKDDWARLWKRSMGLAYDPVVDVRAIKGDILNAVVETFKYSVKPLEAINNPQWLLDVTGELYGTRAVATGGLIKSLLKKTDDPDPTEAENPGVETAMVYRWSHVKAKYIRIDQDKGFAEKNNFACEAQDNFVETDKSHKARNFAQMTMNFETLQVRADRFDEREYLNPTRRKRREP